MYLVLNHFYGLYPDQGCSDYLLAAKQLVTKKHKRALVLLVTPLTIVLEELLPALKLLPKHHLVALINIKQRAISDCVNQRINDFEDADHYAVALSMLNQYKADLKKLAKEGIICVDCDTPFRMWSIPISTLSNRAYCNNASYEKRLVIKKEGHRPFFSL